MKAELKAKWVATNAETKDRRYPLPFTTGFCGGLAFALALLTCVLAVH